MTSCHIPFQKGDKFWSRRPKKQAMKTAKPPSKKNRAKVNLLRLSHLKSTNLKSATHFQRYQSVLFSLATYYF